MGSYFGDRFWLPFFEPSTYNYKKAVPFLGPFFGPKNGTLFCPENWPPARLPAQLAERGHADALATAGISLAIVGET